MPKARTHAAWMAIVCLLLTFTGCRTRQSSSRDAPPPPPPRDLERLELLDTGEEKLRVGPAETFDELAVFPLYSDKQHDIGPVRTLPDALAKGDADVREEESASVGKLTIENKGKVAIYVLAGTVVKGGNQDRQIGQDFVIAPKTTIAADAFCVEHGRWSGEREGVATRGRFTALDQLATSSVRAAGQYEQNQGKVWAKVGEVNDKNGKQTESGSLLASLDDRKISGKRDALARRVNERLAKLPHRAHLVGFGYAVNGRVRGVRWFSSSRLFQTLQGILVNTAAADGITASAGAEKKPAPAPAALIRFVKDVERAAAEERATPGVNANAYKKAKAGYGSSTKLPAAPAIAPVSKDYIAH
jgi:hypothetical protein